VYWVESNYQSTLNRLAFKIAVNEDQIIKQSNIVCKLGNIAKSIKVEEEIEYYHL
jgi:hypothetical protein